MTRAQTLSTASQAVLSDREKAHGSPEDSFGLIATFWSAYLGLEIQPYQVGVLMGLLKIARMKCNPDNEDNMVDLAGYAACVNELREGKVKPTILSYISPISSNNWIPQLGDEWAFNDSDKWYPVVSGRTYLNDPKIKWRRPVKTSHASPQPSSSAHNPPDPACHPADTHSSAHLSP